jgi:hypothetical protein
MVKAARKGAHGVHDCAVGATHCVHSQALWARLGLLCMPVTACDMACLFLRVWFIGVGATHGVCPRGLGLLCMPATACDMACLVHFLAVLLNRAAQNDADSEFGYDC